MICFACFEVMKPLAAKPSTSSAVIFWSFQQFKMKLYTIFTPYFIISASTASSVAETLFSSSSTLAPGAAGFSLNSPFE